MNSIQKSFMVGIFGVKQENILRKMKNQITQL
jgi:hypothetical protein